MIARQALGLDLVFGGDDAFDLAQEPGVELRCFVDLRDAEAALSVDPNDDINFIRVIDIRNQLSSLEGMEAAIEGFGQSSGRQARGI